MTFEKRTLSASASICSLDKHEQTSKTEGIYRGLKFLKRSEIRSISILNSSRMRKKSKCKASIQRLVSAFGFRLSLFHRLHWSTTTHQVAWSTSTSLINNRNKPTFSALVFFTFLRHKLPPPTISLH